MASDNASLLQCTMKKSKQVLWEVLKYGVYLVAGVLAITFCIYGVIALYELILPVSAIFLLNITLVWQFLVAVPWYVYAGIMGVAAIPVYSLLWCIARDLTEEDWKSDTAKGFAACTLLLSCVLSISFFILIMISPTISIASNLLALTILSTFAAIVLAGSIFVYAIDPVNPITRWYYVFRFFGAAYHHYKIIRECPKEITV